MLCMHAMMVDGRTFFGKGDGFAHEFRSRGWTVFVADYRGHGKSGPTVQEGANWNYDDLVLKDLPALIERVRQAHPEGPLVFVGHSLGGHTGLAAAGLRRLMPEPDLFILLSSNLWQPSLEPKLLMRLRKGFILQITKFIMVAMGYFPSRRLRMGPCDEAKDYLDDLHDNWRSDQWLSRDRSLDYGAGLAQMAVPVLSVIGRDDRFMASWDGARNWLESMKLPDGECWLVGGEDPDTNWAPDHMTLVTDPRSRPIWRRVSQWLDDRLAAGATP